MTENRPVPYQEAVRLWGAALLKAHYKRDFNPDEVSVRFRYEEGTVWSEYTQDPSYCEVEITAPGKPHGVVMVTIDADDFDFTKTVGAIVAAAGGVVGMGDE